MAQRCKWYAVPMSDPDPRNRRHVSEAFADALQGIADRSREQRTTEAMGLLNEALKKTPADRNAPDATATWRRATTEAGRKLCADAGKHLYQVRGALAPTEIRCRRCGEAWPVTP